MAKARVSASTVSSRSSQTEGKLIDRHHLGSDSVTDGILRGSSVSTTMHNEFMQR